MKESDSARRLVERLVGTTRAPDAVSAIRGKATEAITQFRSYLGEPEFPLPIEALASLLGISIGEEAPIHSDDAELVPKADGRVEIRVHPDRPATRRRFNIAHEISHTFFPGYELKTWCRTDARHRRRDNPEDLIEMLCDVGASHLLMPEPWFEQSAAQVRVAADLVRLAAIFGVSLEAAMRRFAEGNSVSCAAVFFSWKLKPVQVRSLGRREQMRLFGSYEELIKDAKKLRVDYSILSQAFSATRSFIPCDKSVAHEGVLYQAASSGRPAEGECHLDLGSAAGRYRVLALPVWTVPEERGPKDEGSVAAIIEPLDLPRKQIQTERLFDEEQLTPTRS